MALTPTAPFNDLDNPARAWAPGALAAAHAPGQVAGQASAVSWGAVLAGAAAAAVLSLILLILGVGLGLSSVSPWAAAGISAATFGVSTIVWLAFTQVVAAGAGGYLAGRLRTRWAGVQADEVYFRDTAHGFLAWTVATLVTAALLTSAIASIVSGGVQAGAAVAGGAGAAGGAALAGLRSAPADDGGANPLRYAVDAMLRPAPVNAANAASAPAAGGGAGAGNEPATQASQATQAAGGNPSPSAEMLRILLNTPRGAALSADDLRYAGQLVAQRTGLSQQEAEKRVSDAFTKVQTQLREAEATARDAADKARKASAYAALWLFVSLLAGAFVASLAATFGGRRRDA